MLYETILQRFFCTAYGNSMQPGTHNLLHLLLKRKIRMMLKTFSNTLNQILSSTYLPEKNLDEILIWKLLSWVRILYEWSSLNISLFRVSTNIHHELWTTNLYNINGMVEMQLEIYRYSCVYFLFYPILILPKALISLSALLFTWTNFVN